MTKEHIEAKKRAEEIRKKVAKMVAKSAVKMGQTRTQWKNSEYVAPQRTKFGF